MFKVWAVSLCFNKPEVIRQSLRQYRATSSPDVETVHVLVDQHWPLDQPKTSQELRSLADELGGLYLRPERNLGLARGFNWAVNQLPIPDNAGIIGYDPDSWPVDPCWDLAMCDAFVRFPEAAWFSLWHPHAERELIADRRAKEIFPGTLYEVTSPVMNSVCMIRKKWFREVGGFHEENPLYGGLEIHMWRRLEQSKAKWIFLRNYREAFWPNPEILDTRYRDWKWATTHGREPQIPFGDWLKKRGLV